MEQPLQLTILNFNISLIVLGILVFIVVFSFGYWYQSYREMKPIEIFDIIIIGLFSSLLFSRLFSVMLNFSYYAGNIWLFFDLLDKNFLYIGIFFGIIISVLVIFNNTHREKDFGKFLEKFIISYIFAVIPLLVFVILGGKMLGMITEDESRMPVGLFRIGYNILFLIIWFILKNNIKKEGVLAGLYIILFSIVEFILRVFSQGYTPYLFNLVDFQQIVAALLFIIGLVLFVGSIGHNKVQKGNNFESMGLAMREKRQGFSYSTSGLLQNPKERFSLSYSKMQPEISNLDSQEKIKMLKNRMKRKLNK